MSSFMILQVQVVLLTLFAFALSKPLNEGDMLDPDEFQLFQQIFSSPGNNASVDFNMQNEKLDVSSKASNSSNVTITLGNRNFIQVPCRKGRLRLGMMCREEF